MKYCKKDRCRLIVELKQEKVLQDFALPGEMGLCEQCISVPVEELVRDNVENKFEIKR